MTKPDEYVDRRFLHVKTNKVYIVTGYRLNTTNDKWMLDYMPAFGDSPDFRMSRDMDQFLDGRFLEVK